MGKTAIITGATSGIGAAYAKRLAKEGYDLVLTGRRQDIIRKMADDLARQYNVKTQIIIAELSEEKDIQKVIDAIKAVESLDILVNNAGYLGDRLFFYEQKLADHMQQMKVLMEVPVRLVYAAIPRMTKSGCGTIINISSIGAYSPIKRGVVYTASKAFIRIFTEGLYLELKDKGIKVQVLCPGYIDTDFYRGVPEEKVKANMSGMKKMTAEQVVTCAMKDLEKGKVLCIPGGFYKAFIAMVNIMPRKMIYNFVGKRN